MADDVSAVSTSETCTEVISRIGDAVITDREFLEQVLTAALARGHVLLEDVPGTGKTLTALAFAQALGLEFSRIQFTPDLLPNDITGSHVFNEQRGEFEFTKGPVFANVVLADEINRAPPKTQAALLEAMDEGQVTVDGETRDLPDPFLVIATQNPVEQEGTFELPEAQRDRFMIKTSIGYPDREGELELIERRSARETKMPTIEPALDTAGVKRLQQVPERISMGEAVRGYLVDLARETRRDDRVKIGISPRGIQRYFEAARARAAISGREYVAPDDVKRIAEPVMQHRLVLTTDAQIEGVDGAAVVKNVLDRVEVPAVEP
ncbi:AAA-type ATPase (MoxR subfamily) [Natrialba magadii ATCC 43099]|uniref:ATPase n=1 Tax=Natrialba magadii (strain ATCC 43099 / DSM 3394 / CCM 3739 / CIP 104546 / IAM 13178 / JCM 8861 / NBRC 102185 / NCIMB 2190 / MS3) TaxID=547559 RepID=D3SUL1_NATMM|nr:MoxR family ATPase [Natrialba magadii]ADD05269.1 AAA-type ATPase (MoxR subfamily) [Natrialba magadii ATCC 43099]ELY29009.1 ATPase [Natrialba magadii ATCC 43099]